jgi:hypothetical protein
MNRRLACVMSTMLSAWAIYVVYFFLALRQIGKHLIRCELTSAGRQVAVAPVQIFGKAISFWQIAAVLSFVPLTLCVYVIYSTARQHYRANHDRCVKCGHALPDWHGRCPGCGVRIGPDPCHVVHTLRG